MGTTVKSKSYGRAKMAIAALAAVLLLVPIGSARGATLHRIRYCGQLTTSNGYQPITLKPGQVCSLPPLAVRSAITTWEIVKRGTREVGSVCFGVVQSPPGWPNGKPLSPTGSGPGNYWYCSPWDIADHVGGYGFTPYWQAQNAFNAVYGQPVVVNFSGATIKTRPNYSDGYWDTLWYYA